MTAFKNLFVITDHVEIYSFKNTDISLFLEHVYMRPEVNSNRFEISLRDKTSLRYKVTSLLAFT